MAITNVREQVYQIIRDRIIGLKLKPWSALNDKELAEELGISRTPVREALIMLNVAGLVVVRPQSGTFVAPIDLEVVEMEQFTRCALEKEMVQSACKHLTPVHKSLYEENLYLYDFYEHSEIPNREEKLLELDNDFHRIAFAINKRERYFDRMLATMLHIERLRMLSLSVVKNDSICSEHRSIVQAITTGDETEAGHLIIQHMNLYQLHLEKIKKQFPHFLKQDSK